MSLHSPTHNAGASTASHQFLRRQRLCASSPRPRRGPAHRRPYSSVSCAHLEAMHKQSMQHQQWVAGRDREKRCELQQFPRNSLTMRDSNKTQSKDWSCVSCTRQKQCRWCDGTGSAGKERRTVFHAVTAHGSVRSGSWSYATLMINVGWEMKKKSTYFLRLVCNNIFKIK